MEGAWAYEAAGDMDRYRSISNDDNMIVIYGVFNGHILKVPALTFLRTEGIENKPTTNNKQSIQINYNCINGF